MLLEPRRHPVIAFLEAAFATIEEEWAALPADRFVPMPYPELLQGEWSAYGIFHGPCDPGWAARCDANAARCPRTRALVERIDGANLAVWLRLGPHSRIRRHSDVMGVLRFHLPMTPDRGAWIQVGEQTARHVRGSCLGFDPAIEHETANEGPVPRDLFVLDVLADRARRPPR